MKPYIAKHWYTVLLKRPDYISDSPDDTYMTHVLTPGIKSALTAAREEAAKQDDPNHHDANPDANPDDYLCLCLIKGKVKDLNPER